MRQVSADQLATQARLLSELQAGGCFDFDYKPQPHDVCVIHCAGHNHRFRFEGGWQNDDSNSLTGWRAQMVPLRGGAVGRTAKIVD